MDHFTFIEFIDHKDEKYARLETAAGQIPVILFAEEGSDFDLHPGDPCRTNVMGVGSDFEIYAAEEDYYRHHERFASVSLFPLGLYPPASDDGEWDEIGHVLFSGVVKDFLRDPEPEDELINCRITVETLEMTIELYTKYDGNIEKGFILRGTAWLFGAVKK